MTTVIHSVKDGQKFAGDTSLTVVTCYSCHMTYAIPTSLYTSAVAYPGNRPNGWKLSCPLGHTWWYTGTSKDEQLEQARNRLARERANHDQTQARLRSQRGATTRAKNQRDAAKALIAEGICPVDGCGRQCKDLERHMRSKHPDYADRAHLPHGDIEG